MSVELAQPDIIVVDSTTTLLSLLDDLVSLTVSPLYLDLEGVNLGRHGSISIISLYITTIEKLYLIDIHGLGKIAFSATNSGAISLKTVLESPTISKVIFDIRTHSDALFSHFQISVDGIKDLQLMEFAARAGWRENLLVDLAKCIEQDSPISIAAQAEWQRTQEDASRLCDPQKGGRYEIFNERPMRPEVIRYCARKVALSPGLHHIYNVKLREDFWQVQVQKATRDWIKLSQSPRYDGHAKTKAHGPWDNEDIEQAMEVWNEAVWFDSKIYDHDYENRSFDDYYEDERFDDYGDEGARGCIGWEEDMIKNGELF